MTRKQELFCEYYIETLNATQAAIKAGYSKKTAYSIGDENLKKPEIKKYIDRKMSEKTEIIIANQDEILIFLTSVMKNSKEDTKNRIKAAELLGKRWGIWDSKIEELAGMVDDILNGNIKKVN